VNFVDPLGQYTGEPTPHHVQKLDAQYGQPGGWPTPVINGEPRPDLTFAQVDKMRLSEIANIIGGDTGPEFFDHGDDGLEALGKIFQELTDKLIEIYQGQGACD